VAKKKMLADRTPVERCLIGLVFLISLVIVGFTERDIQIRPESEMRGPKFAWRLASLNAVGALAYLGTGIHGSGGGVTKFHAPIHASFSIGPPFISLGC
jgi:hypothetical protein